MLKELKFKSSSVTSAWASSWVRVPCVWSWLPSSAASWRLCPAPSCSCPGPPRSLFPTVGAVTPPSGWAGHGSLPTWSPDQRLWRLWQQCTGIYPENWMLVTLKMVILKLINQWWWWRHHVTERLFFRTVIKLEIISRDHAPPGRKCLNKSIEVRGSKCTGPTNFSGKVEKLFGCFLQPKI